MSPASTAPNEKVVAAASRLTEKLVTSRSGVAVPTNVGRISPAGSDTVAATAGVPAKAATITSATLVVLIGLPLFKDAPPER
jgi:hypothetical protein